MVFHAVDRTSWSIHIQMSRVNSVYRTMQSLNLELAAQPQSTVQGVKPAHVNGASIIDQH